MPSPEERAHGAASAVAPDQIARPRYITTGQLLDVIRGYYFDDDPGSAAAWTLDL